MPATHGSRLTLCVNGLPYIHCSDLNDEVNTNREVVMGMSPTGTAIGVVNGAKEYSFTVEASIPLTGDIRWEDIDDGILSFTPEGGTATTLYAGVFVKSVKRRYTEQGIAKRTIECGALVKVGT